MTAGMSEVNVRYEDNEWPVRLGGLTTIKEILLSSLINHGLPTLAHDKFRLFHANGDLVDDPSGNAIFAGINPGDTLVLKYLPDAGPNGDVA